MVFLWLRSRIGASAACRCVSCISRRAIRTPAGAPVKSRGRLTTLYYSTIISTAAAADSALKGKRRDEWDAKIGELEQSLRSEAVAQDDTVTAEPSLELEGSGRKDALQDSEETRPQYQLFPSNIDPRVANLGAPFLAAWNSVQAPMDIQARLLGGCMSREVSPQSIHADVRRRRIRDLSCWVDKTVARAEYLVLKLATQLMMSASNVDPERAKILASTLEMVDKTILLFKDLGPYHLGDLPRLQYPQYDPRSRATEFDMDQQALRDVLGRNFSDAARGAASVDDLLNNIAHNLLVSPVAPDATTYSLLISRFGKLVQRHDLADHVVDCYKMAHVRPNELSMCAVLEHCIRARKYGRFHRHVQVHQGYFGGPMLAKSGIRTDRPDAGSSKLRVGDDGRIIQLMDFDQRLYFTIIYGYRSFGQYQIARLWHNAMERDNVHFEIYYINRLLEDAAHRHHWKEGFQTWTLIKRLLRADYDGSITRDDIIEAYYWKLRLCRECRRSETYYQTICAEAFDDYGFTLDELETQPEPRLMSKSDDAKQRSLKIRSLEAQVTRIETTIRMMEVDILASKLVTLRMSEQTVERLFIEHGKGDKPVKWLWERPWPGSVQDVDWQPLETNLPLDSDVPLERKKAPTEKPLDALELHQSSLAPEANESVKDPSIIDDREETFPDPFESQTDMLATSDSMRVFRVSGDMFTVPSYRLQSLPEKQSVLEDSFSEPEFPPISPPDSYVVSDISTVLEPAQSRISFTGATSLFPEDTLAEPAFPPIIPPPNQSSALDLTSAETPDRPIAPPQDAFDSRAYDTITMCEGTTLGDNIMVSSDDQAMEPHSSSFISHYVVKTTGGSAGDPKAFDVPTEEPDTDDGPFMPSGTELLNADPTPDLEEAEISNASPDFGFADLIQGEFERSLVQDDEQLNRSFGDDQDIFRPQPRGTDTTLRRDMAEFDSNTVEPASREETDLEKLMRETNEEKPRKKRAELPIAPEWHLEPPPPSSAPPRAEEAAFRRAMQQAHDDRVRTKKVTRMLEDEATEDDALEPRPVEAKQPAMFSHTIIRFRADGNREARISAARAKHVEAKKREAIAFLDPSTFTDNPDDVFSGNTRTRLSNVKIAQGKAMIRVVSHGPSRPSSGRQRAKRRARQKE